MHLVVISINLLEGARRTTTMPTIQAGRCWGAKSGRAQQARSDDTGFDEQQ